MHETLKEIQEQLEDLETAIDDTITHESSFGQQSGNWSFPGLSKLEISSRVREIRDSIEAFGTDKLQKGSKQLTSYPSRIRFLIDHTIPNLEGNPQVGVSTLYLTLDGLERALKPNLNGDPNKEATQRVKNLNKRLRSREAQLDNLSPKLDELDQKIERIENAHSTADQLPTDLQALREARASINQIHTEVEAQRKLVTEASAEIQSVSDALNQRGTEAKSILERCETAYSAATSVGLAKAFSE
ncbi:MAG: hypothetical protein ABJP82_00015, partial [Hyphomicrobiales bacterium]